MPACATCGGGKAKRQCPALGRAICPTCCGSKRQVEIRCPSDCGWLRTSLAHPHAARLRQQELDAGMVVPLLRGLDDGGYAVLMACLSAAVAHRGEADPAPLDVDLEQAAEALAAGFQEALGIRLEPSELTPGEVAAAAELQRSVYGHQAWTGRH